jgi:transposase
VLNPLQTRRYRDVVRRKAKTDDIDAHVIAGLLRSGAAQASYVPDEQIQSLRELARLRARLLADRQEVDRAATTLLPPSEPGTGPSDAELLQTIPGVGPQTAATLLGELGALTRFTNARALVAYVGFYPVIHESGDRAATPRLSPVGSRVARHSLYLAAVNAVRRNGEWRTIYLRKKAQGKPAKQALIVVAVKLLHAVYAMLKHRQPYNPSRLLVAPATIAT